MRISVKVLILVTLFLIARPAISFAKSYDKISIGLYGTANTNKSQLHDTWEAQPGYGFKVSTPVMSGELQITYSFLEMQSKTSSIPDYTSSLFTLGWSFKLNIWRNIELYVGPTYGNYKMAFDDPNIADKTKTESEICMGLNVELQYQIHKNMYCEFAMIYNEVFTHKRMYLTFFRSGLIYRFDAPGWWQKAWE